MNRQQRGFTLIELVVVITLIGILAAVALPKFINIQKDARASVMKGVVGSMRGAAALVYSKSMLAGTETNATGTVTLASGTSVTTAYGYPTADAAGIVAAMDLTPDLTTTGTGPLLVQFKANPLATCEATYTAAAKSGTLITPATATATTTGC